MDPLILSLISACTALVASIAGPVVTLMVAKRQFSANVLSTNRQKWIDALREALAEMISLLVAALVVKSNWRDAWEGGRAPLANDAALLDKVQRLVLAQSKIHLLINPNEADHQQLCTAIDGALLRLRSEHSEDSETEADIQLITRLAQKILKREWQRVKRGI
jgi:hypothetical protein